MTSSYSRRQLRAWESISYLMICMLLLLLIPECRGKHLPETTSHAVEKVEIEGEMIQRLNATCHKELFPRFGLAWPITVCVHKGMEWYVSEEIPGSNWINVRFRMIADSLHRIERHGYPIRTTSDQ